MIKLSVDNMTVEDFIHVLKTYSFKDIYLWEQFIKDFFAYYDRQLKVHILLKEKSKQRKIYDDDQNKLEDLYQNVMLVIDDRMCERSEYFERIEKKKLYPPEKYKHSKKNGNTKRKTQVGKSHRHNKTSSGK